MPPRTGTCSHYLPLSSLTLASMEEIVELMPREFTQIQFDLEQKLLDEKADEFRQAAENIKLQQIRKYD